ncbi:hypothetical protein CCS38_34670, partial [Streptomyces purpurogeneiscleroticus]|nr:hypothetical protein [Streptomyces purpurogeneiscleroticus]
PATGSPARRPGDPAEYGAGASPVYGPSVRAAYGSGTGGGVYGGGAYGGRSTRTYEGGGNAGGL